MLKKKYMKFISLFTTALLIFNNFQVYSYALNNTLFSNNLAHIESSYKGSSSNHIYLIQNLHCNQEAQKKIYEIIKILKNKHRNTLKIVGIEGAYNKLDTSIFNTIKNPFVRNKLTNFFFQKCDITGAELYDINNPGHIELIGVEDKKLYKENFLSLYKSLKYREQLLRNIKKMSKALDRGKNILYPESVKKIEQLEQKYNLGQINLYAFIKNILQFFPQANLNEYPNIYILLKNPVQRANINMLLLFEEIDNLIYQIKQNFLNKSSHASKLLFCDEYLKLYKKYINNESTIKDKEKWEVNRNKFFIIAKEIITKLEPENILKQHKDLINISDKTMNEFYNTALKRNEFIVRNLTKTIDKSKTPSHSVLIIGGFHTQGITQILRNKGISYEIITPNITKKIDKKIILAQNLALN